MNTNLISINSINSKSETTNVKVKQRSNKDFESSIYGEIEKSNEKKDDEVIDNEEEPNIEKEKEKEKEKEYINNEDYLYIFQKLNEYKDKNNISELDTIELNISNNIGFQNIILDQELDENKIETLDIEYLNNIQEDSTFKDVYDISYKVSYKDQLNLNNLNNISDRVETHDEYDVLGKISMIEHNNLFTKNNFINNKDKEIQNAFQSDIENKLNDETVKNIKLMKTEDIKELSIKLRPRELGDMHIKLLQENDTLKAIITVTDKDVYNMINKNITDLKQHIEAFNVKEIAIVIDSDNNYGSDSFDKNFEEHRHKNEHQTNHKNKNKNKIYIDKEHNNIQIKDDGLNLLA